ncbi:MAG: hypothetical protein H0U27_05500 [Nitrosopumilus sp.]|nr:hypothetical protein [Nitrosopumilus sp.]
MGILKICCGSIEKKNNRIRHYLDCLTKTFDGLNKVPILEMYISYFFQFLDGFFLSSFKGFKPLDLPQRIGGFTRFGRPEVRDILLLSTN